MGHNIIEQDGKYYVNSKLVYKLECLNPMIKIGYLFPQGITIINNATPFFISGSFVFNNVTFNDSTIHKFYTYIFLVIVGQISFGIISITDNNNNVVKGTIYNFSLSGVNGRYGNTVIISGGNISGFFISGTTGMMQISTGTINYITFPGDFTTFDPNLELILNYNGQTILPYLPKAILMNNDCILDISPLNSNIINNLQLWYIILIQLQNFGGTIPDNSAVYDLFLCQFVISFPPPLPSLPPLYAIQDVSEAQLGGVYDLKSGDKIKVLINKDIKFYDKGSKFNIIKLD
ncbi:MAG: hypothetical protein QW478_00295 [Candidatus Micrarchaeaceae archaeon]